MVEEKLLYNLSQVIPQDKLVNMRKLIELKPYLPLDVAGVRISWDDSESGNTSQERGGSFYTVSNTPAMTDVGKHYDPREVVALLEKLPRDYDPELVEWEGEFSDILKPRGGRNPFHLLEQALVAGPDGDEFKRGPSPIPWDLAYAATDSVISKLKEVVPDWGRIRPKHMVVGTPSSHASSLRIAHVMDKSAGLPWFGDPKVARTSKLHSLPSIMALSSKFLLPTASAPKWPATVFARGDRAAPWNAMMDNDDSLSRSITTKKDRMIAGQSAALQFLDGLFTQRLNDLISESSVPEIDMREPWYLSNWFEHGKNMIERDPSLWSMGGDESAWDQHFTPQLAYLCYTVYKSAFVDEAIVCTTKQEQPYVFPEPIMLAMNHMAEGETAQFSVNEPVSGDPATVRVRAHSIDTDAVLRRIWAGCFGSSFQFGNIRVDGYEHVLDTPRDGKFLAGFSMRSGNFMTFLVNSLGNWIKHEVINLGSKRVDGREWFRETLGEEPPNMDLRWLVTRGDDSGSVWELDGSDSIAKSWTDWMRLMGAKANEKKQDTADKPGRWRMGFAQIFTNEVNPRGVSSAVRVSERNIWDERDEVVLFDPDSGIDMRPYLKLMASFGRLNNLWGVWNREAHPLAAEITGLFQDLDREKRLRPPLNEEERLNSARAFALRMLRRGQISPEQITGIVTAFWGTDLAQYVQRRLDREAKLQTDWTPIPWHEDARDIWRGTVSQKIEARNKAGETASDATQRVKDDNPTAIVTFEEPDTPPSAAPD